MNDNLALEGWLPVVPCLGIVEERRRSQKRPLEQEGFFFFFPATTVFLFTPLSFSLAQPVPGTSASAQWNEAVGGALGKRQGSAR